MPLQNFFRRRFDTWLDKRLPRTGIAALNSKSVFTFPSKAGFGFLVVMALLWLVAINYENNIIFGLGALLGAIFVITIFHSYANLAGLRVQVRSIGAGFPSEMLKVELELSQHSKRHRDDILLSFAGEDPLQVVLPDGKQTATATLYVPARKRGKQVLGRLTVESTYPLGLIRVWTHILLDGYGVVYPRPIAGSPQANGEEGDRIDGKAILEGREDFAGLKEYRPGESASRIAWKQFARGQGLHAKSFSDPVADPQWLDWDSYPGLDREARLSRLCHALLECAKRGEPFGLRLPGKEYPLAAGSRHRDQLLVALALFESGGSQA